MQSRLLWASLVGLGFAGACVVPSFTVDPAEPAEGGAGAGIGGKSGSAGNPPSEGGSDTGTAAKGSTGGTAGTGAIGEDGGGDVGATSAGGKSNPITGGTGSVEAGAGGAAEGGADTGPATSFPTRIGFSVFHDSASGSDQASSHLADATFKKPTGTQPGDLLFVFFGADHSLQNLTGTALSALGWTLQDQRADYGTDGQGTYLLYRIADGTEPDPIVFKDINGTPSGNGVQGLLAVYRGVNPTEPINAYDKIVTLQGEDTPSKHVENATPSITTTVDRCLLIAGLSPDTQVDAPIVNVWPDGFTQNHTSVTNPPTPYPFGWANIYTAERPQAKAGPVPASKFGWNIQYDGISWFGSLTFVIALAPK